MSYFCGYCGVSAGEIAEKVAEAKAQGAAEATAAIVSKIDRVVSVTRELIVWADDHVSECSCDDCRNALIRMARVDALNGLKVFIEMRGDHITKESNDE